MVDVEILHCKCRFGTIIMFAITPQDLDLYPAMDQRYMNAIFVDYIIKVGYWALKNNVQEYKVYV